MKKDIIPVDTILNIKEYAEILEHIKTDILQTQLRAASSISQELTMLYWRIGKSLSEKIEVEGWGAKIVVTLSKDLARAFPGISGLSLRNLQYMQKFAKIYKDSNCAMAVAQLPWGHNVTLLEKLENNDQRLYKILISLLELQVIQRSWLILYQKNLKANCQQLQKSKQN